MMFEDSCNATSSRGLAGGHSPSGLPGGVIQDLFGRDPVHARNIHLLPTAERSPGTGGRSGRCSSLQIALTLCLVSRLMRRWNGLMPSALTWKPWGTKSARQFCRLAVSVRIMSASGFTLRATPTATANQSAASMQKHPGCRGLVVNSETWRERMGYPKEWAQCEPMGTQSFRK